MNGKVDWGFLGENCRYKVCFVLSPPPHLLRTGKLRDVDIDEKTIFAVQC